MGIEPTSPAWKAGVIPLYDARKRLTGTAKRLRPKLYARHPELGEAGFEPAKAEPPDLQSGPFDRSGIPPDVERTASNGLKTAPPQCRTKRTTGESITHWSLELAVGLEPTTSGLQNRGSAIELR